MTIPRRKFLVYFSAAGLSLLTRYSSAEIYAPGFSHRRRQDPGVATIVDSLEQPESLRQSSRKLILENHQTAYLRSGLQRLKRLQEFVGYANFNLIGWRRSHKLANHYPQIGPFELPELKLIEQIFYADAKRMGFLGERVTAEISNSINREDVVKIPGTGHYLFKGRSLDIYHRIRRDIGDSVVLTSGVRNVVKQTYLFLKRITQADGNLSAASYSVAPPGYSYHAIGDFDIGKVNFDWRNFTSAIVGTEEYKSLSELDYVEIRYPKNNKLGLKYEPWHLKIA